MSMTIERVYYVESPDMLVGHLAIRPTFSKDKATWFDTSTPMIVHLAHSTFENYNKDQIPEKIKLTSKDGDRFFLELLTLEIYNEKIKEGSVGQKEYKALSDLQNYYLTTDFVRYD